MRGYAIANAVLQANQAERNRAETQELTEEQLNKIITELPEFETLINQIIENKPNSTLNLPWWIKPDISIAKENFEELEVGLDGLITDETLLYFIKKYVQTSINDTEISKAETIKTKILNSGIPTNLFNQLSKIYINPKLTKASSGEEYVFNHYAYQVLQNWRVDKEKEKLQKIAINNPIKNSDQSNIFIFKKNGRITDYSCEITPINTEEKIKLTIEPNSTNHKFPDLYISFNDLKIPLSSYLEPNSNNTNFDSQQFQQEAYQETARSSLELQAKAFINPEYVMYSEFLRTDHIPTSYSRGNSNAGGYYVGDDWRSIDSRVEYKAHDIDVYEKPRRINLGDEVISKGSKDYLIINDPYIGKSVTFTGRNLDELREKKLDYLSKQLDSVAEKKWELIIKKYTLTIQEIYLDKGQKHFDKLLEKEKQEEASKQKELAELQEREKKQKELAEFIENLRQERLQNLQKWINGETKILKLWSNPLEEITQLYEVVWAEYETDINFILSGVVESIEITTTKKQKLINDDLIIRLNLKAPVNDKNQVDYSFGARANISKQISSISKGLKVFSEEYTIGINLDLPKDKDRAEVLKDILQQIQAKKEAKRPFNRELEKSTTIALRELKLKIERSTDTIAIRKEKESPILPNLEEAEISEKLNDLMAKFIESRRASWSKKQIQDDIYNFLIQNGLSYEEVTISIIAENCGDGDPDVINSTWIFQAGSIEFKSHPNQTIWYVTKYDPTQNNDRPVKIMLVKHNEDTLSNSKKRWEITYSNAMFVFNTPKLIADRNFRAISNYMI